MSVKIKKQPLVNIQSHVGILSKEQEKDVFKPLARPVDLETIDEHIEHMLNLKKLGYNVERYIKQNKKNIEGLNISDKTMPQSTFAIRKSKMKQLGLKDPPFPKENDGESWSELDFNSQMEDWEIFTEHARALNELGFDIKPKIKENTKKITEYVEKKSSKIWSGKDAEELVAATYTVANMLALGMDLRKKIKDKSKILIEKKNDLLKEGNYVDGLTLTVALVEMGFISQNKEKEVLPPLRDFK